MKIYNIISQKYSLIVSQLENINFSNFSGIIRFSHGDKAWYSKGKFHRKNGPAIEYINGTKVWHKNGELHRLDGPAVEFPNKTKSYYIDGINYSEANYWEIVKTK